MKFVNFTAKELLLLAKILRAILSGIEIPGLTAEEKTELEPLRARLERKGWS